MAEKRAFRRLIKEKLLVSEIAPQVRKLFIKTLVAFSVVQFFI